MVGRQPADAVGFPGGSSTDGPEAMMAVRFLTSAARLLAAVIQEPGATMRDLGRRCDRTERVIWQQLQDLERAGLLRRRRQGRRNHYEVDLPAVERQLMMESAPLRRVAGGAGTR